MATVDARRIEYVPLDDVAPAARNPKRHRTAALVASVNRFGFVTPGLRDERTGRLVAGHGRAEVLRQLRDGGAAPPAGVRLDERGAWLVPVIAGWSSRSDAEADAYLVADNRHAELGGWDQQELTDLLATLNEADPDLLGATGYDDGDLADLLKANTPADLDELAKELGDPDPSDMWPSIRIKTPPHVMAAWRAYLDTHGGRELAAFAALLDVDAEPPAATAGWDE